MEREGKSLPGDLEAGRYANVVRRARAGGASAHADLQRLFGRGVRWLLRRSL
jgi:hypothetical protein